MEQNYLRSLSKKEEMNLLTAAQKGDNSAATALLAQYDPLARAAASRAWRSDSYDEALCEAFFALYRAIMSYDKGKGVPFAAWARAKVYGDIRTLTNRANREIQRRQERRQDLHGRWTRRSRRRFYRGYTRLAGRVQGPGGQAAVGTGR